MAALAGDAPDGWPAPAPACRTSGIGTGYLACRAAA